jgi:hypothetical protein
MKKLIIVAFGLMAFACGNKTSDQEAEGTTNDNATEQSATPAMEDSATDNTIRVDTVSSSGSGSSADSVRRQ